MIQHKGAETATTKPPLLRDQVINTCLQEDRRNPSGIAQGQAAFPCSTSVWNPAKISSSATKRTRSSASSAISVRRISGALVFQADWARRSSVMPAHRLSHRRPLRSAPPRPRPAPRRSCRRATARRAPHPAEAPSRSPPQRGRQ